MTPDEWVDVARRINATWPHAAIPQATLAKYYDDLRATPWEHAVAAVEVMHREGREFPPTAGMIVRKVVELQVDAPEWGEVARRLRRLLAYPENVLRAGVLVDARAARLEREHPLIRSFVQTVGWQEIACCPEDDRVAEAQLRTKWERFVHRTHRDGALAGLPTAGLPTLERARREGLTRPDYLVGLPKPDEEAA